MNLRDYNLVYITDEITADSFERFVKDVDAVLRRNLMVIINSVGGDFTAGLAIADVIRSIGDVTTLALGCVYSSAFLVFLAGSRRLSTPYADFMSHRVHFETVGPASTKNLEDRYWIDQQVKYIKMVTKLPKKFIVNKLTANHDYFLNPVEAKKLRLVDKIERIKV